MQKRSLMTWLITILLVIIGTSIFHKDMDGGVIALLIALVPLLAAFIATKISFSSGSTTPKKPLTSTRWLDLWGWFIGAGLIIALGVLIYWKRDDISDYFGSWENVARNPSSSILPTVDIQPQPRMIPHFGSWPVTIAPLRPKAPTKTFTLKAEEVANPWKQEVDGQVTPRVFAPNTNFVVTPYANVQVRCAIYDEFGNPAFTPWSDALAQHRGHFHCTKGGYVELALKSPGRKRKPHAESITIQQL